MKMSEKRKQELREILRSCTDEEIKEIWKLSYQESLKNREAFEECVKIDDKLLTSEFLEDIEDTYERMIQLKEYQDYAKTGFPYYGRVSGLLKALEGEEGARFTRWNAVIENRKKMWELNDQVWIKCEMDAIVREEEKRRKNK